MSRLVLSQLQTADILLWRALRPREYLISWVLRSPYHHASLVDIRDEPVSLDQNIDLVSESPVLISDLLKKGYRFDVLRYRHPLSELRRTQIRDTFLELQKLPYSYGMAFKVVLGRSYLPSRVRPIDYWLEKSPLKVGILYQDARDLPAYYYARQYTSITCSGAVFLAYCINGLSPPFRLDDRIRFPVSCLPADLASYPVFEKIGVLYCPVVC